MRLGLKVLALLFLPVLFWAIITAPIVNADPGPDPMASLRVSLPAGFYVDIDPDPWQHQSWVLMLSGTTWTFDVNVTQKHEVYPSYDTHLVIALTEDGYNKLSSITISGGASGIVTIDKTDFTWGSPTYYMYVMPSHGIYDTWFYDGYIVGDLSTNESVILSISATFSPDTIGVKMHFDAYGKRENLEPPDLTEGEITHNPWSVDATVKPPPPSLPEVSIATPLATSIGTILLLATRKVLKRKRD